MTPRRSIEAEAERRGRKEFVRGCRALVRGEETDPQLLPALGGPPARKFLDGQPHRDDYWLRVWGLRGLLWVWADDAVPEVRLSLGDMEWRSREMALKVATRHDLDDVLEEVVTLREDTVPRVRRQADRYLMLVTAEQA